MWLPACRPERTTHRRSHAGPLCPVSDRSWWQSQQLDIRTPSSVVPHPSGTVDGAPGVFTKGRIPSERAARGGSAGKTPARVMSSDVSQRASFRSGPGEFLRDQLRDLGRVQRGALAQVVAAHEKLDLARVVK